MPGHLSCFVCHTQHDEQHLRQCCDNGEWNIFTVCKRHCPTHAGGQNADMKCLQPAS